MINVIDNEYCLKWSREAAACPYSWKIQTVFTQGCFPGKHLLSYYHEDVNVADVRVGIYMTIQQLPKDFMALLSPRFLLGH